MMVRRALSRKQAKEKAQKLKLLGISYYQASIYANFYVPKNNPSTVCALNLKYAIIHTFFTPFHFFMYTSSEQSVSV